MKSEGVMRELPEGGQAKRGARVWRGSASKAGGGKRLDELRIRIMKEGRRGGSGNINNEF